MTAVEQLIDQLTSIGVLEIPQGSNVVTYIIKNAKAMEKEQRGYSEEEVRLAYFQGEKDSYIKGGQTKEMENEFIQSLQQKHELNKSYC